MIFILNICRKCYRKAAELFVKFRSAGKIAGLKPEDLMTVTGIGEKLAVKILEGLRK